MANRRTLKEIPQFPQPRFYVNKPEIPTCWPFRSAIQSDKSVSEFRRCNNIAVADVCSNTETCAWKEQSTNYSTSPQTYEEKLEAFHGCMPTSQMRGFNRWREQNRRKIPSKSATYVMRFGNAADAAYVFRRKATIESLRVLNSYIGEPEYALTNDIDRTRSIVQTALKNGWMIRNVNDKDSESDHQKLQKYFDRFEEWYALNNQSSNRYVRAK